MSEKLPTVDELDIIGLAGSKAKGKRPFFLKDPDVERVLGITMALAGELSVLRARLDTVECLLETQGSISKADIEAFTPNDAQTESRGRWNQEYLARILRVVQQEREAVQRGEEESAEDVGHKLAEE